MLGVSWVVTLFPWLSGGRRQALRQWWSRRLIRILGFTLTWEGGRVPAGAMVVANHISWVDIFAMNALVPSAFISKAEVRQWPVIGWLAARNDTVFLRRGSRGHARLINEEIAQLLEQGKVVAVFPEGTTTDGTHVLHFHGALLQPALLAGKPIVPVAVSYWDAAGARSVLPAYVGEMSLGECLKSIAGARGLRIRLVVGAPLGRDGDDRRAVARQAREVISLGAGLPLPSN